LHGISASATTEERPAPSARTARPSTLRTRTESARAAKTSLRAGEGAAPTGGSTEARTKSLGWLPTRCRKLTATESVESIAQLSAIDIDRFAGDRHDTGRCLSGETWRQQT
jgi:hypothetical protein